MSALHDSNDPEEAGRLLAPSTKLLIYVVIFSFYVSQFTSHWRLDKNGCALGLLSFSG